MQTFIKVGSVMGVVALFLVGFLFFRSPASVEPPAGAVSGPDSYFPCESHNGVTTCTDRKVFSLSSTTVASFKSPTATSTLRIAAGSITTASTTALDFEWGWSYQPDATTTSLGKYNLAASQKAVILASTTPSAPSAVRLADESIIIPPNSFVNLKYGGALCGNASPTACSTVVGTAIVEFKY